MIDDNGVFFKRVLFDPPLIVKQDTTFSFKMNITSDDFKWECPNCGAKFARPNGTRYGCVDCDFSGWDI